MDDERLLLRIRAICCASWGIPPPEFDRLMRQDCLAVEDVVETVLLRASDPLGGDIRAYLFREADQERRTRHAQIVALVAEVRATADPERQEILRARIRELQ